MTRDLTDVFTHALDAQERDIAGITPQPATFARTVRRVRHRRLVRHSAETSLTVVAVAGLATAGWLGTRGTQAPPPAQTPSPTVVTPSPSTTPVPTPVTLPGLPPMLTLPDGVLTGTTPGWVIATYRPVSSDGTVAGQYVVLTSAQGERYLVADVSAADELRVIGWDAGSTTARVLTHDVPGTLDLLTGAVTPDPRALPAGAVHVATVMDGAEVWMTPVEGADPPATWLLPREGDPRQTGSLGSSTTRVSVSPDGRLVASDTASAQAVVVVDVTTGERTEIEYPVTDGQCSTVGWTDATGVLAQCFDYTDGFGPLEWNPRLVRADLTGAVTLVRQQVAGDSFTTAAAGTYVSDGVVAFAGVPLTPELGMAESCPQGVYLTDGTPVLVASGTTRVDAVGGAVYVGVTPGCAAGGTMTELTVHDAGTQVVLGPVPAGDWSTSLSSWVVAR
ncbi:hypothetical protein [Cellulomonas sp. P5_C5]